MKRLLLIALASLLLCVASLPVLAQEDATAAVVGDNNAFAFDLYREMAATTSDGFVFSPFSVSLALAMTYNGALDETAAQMASTMHFTLEKTALNRALADVTAQLLQAGNAEATEYEPERRLAIANALWGEQSFPFNADFLAQLEADYDAGLNLVDFIGAAEAARARINTWIEDNTNGLIRDIVPPGAVSELTRLALANAVYFKSNWIAQFEEDLTQDGLFTRLDGSTVSTAMMHQQARFLYLDEDGYQAVSLPYGGGIAMEIYLPDAGTFETFEQNFTPDGLLMLRGSAAYGPVILTLPRWKTQTDAPMTDLLQRMGMTLPFTGDADFSGMIDTSQTAERLAISRVLHKAFISVDEHGTEAAAATVVLMEATGAPRPQEPFVFTADRPFVYTIVDQTTGTILFMGRVLDPSQEA
ncbi:MAG: serpin family protein [Anaerolineae bacterium]|nr:serpin family protein [Anaerolineae bacterium]NUQ04844.1 serpin family protein [Anaerolineae bacterium]